MDTRNLVADCPLAHLDYTALLVDAGQETHYVIELFYVQLVDDSIRLEVQNDPKNRWLAADDIQRTSCRDGQPVSETMGLLLAKAELL